MGNQMAEWVEVEGASVSLAVEAGLEELGISDPDAADVKVVREPKPGFLGLGRRDAMVIVKPKTGGKKRRRRRPRKRGATKSGSQQTRQQRSPKSAESSKERGKRPTRQSDQTASEKGRRSKSGKKKGKKGNNKPQGKGSVVSDAENNSETLGKRQAEVVEDFLAGLLTEFGLEGTVESKFDGRYVEVDVSGEQTEALIGPKASVMQAVHELTKTIVQRKTARGARLRLDVAGYGARRREALAIYVGELAEQLSDEGGEIMLEPMNPSDRKVVHDAAAAIDGIKSYSEGSEPRRSVVLSLE